MIHEFQTPKPVCRYMVDILSFYSDIDTVLEPTPGIGNLSDEISKNGYQVVSPKNYWRLKPDVYDAAVMNPPFTPMKVGYKFLYSVMERTNIVVALMPWLTVINSAKRSLHIKNWGLVKIVHLPRNVFPGSRVQTCILHMQKGWNKETKFYFYPDSSP